MRYGISYSVFVVDVCLIFCNMNTVDELIIQWWLNCFHGCRQHNYHSKVNSKDVIDI